MKEILWIALIAALNLLAYRLVTGPWYPGSQLSAFLVGAFFFLSSFGGLWMMYVAVRYESKHWHWVGLAFIPFTFLWYYIERFRTGAYNNRTL